MACPGIVMIETFLHTGNVLLHLQPQRQGTGFYLHVNLSPLSDVAQKTSSLVSLPVISLSKIGFQVNFLSFLL